MSSVAVSCSWYEQKIESWHADAGWLVENSDRLHEAGCMEPASPDAADGLRRKFRS